METKASALAAIRRAKTRKEAMLAGLDVQRRVSEELHGVVMETMQSLPPDPDPEPTPAPAAPPTAKEQLRQAKLARLGYAVDPSDPTTWPEDMQKHLAEQQVVEQTPVWEVPIYEADLFDTKRDLLCSAMIERIGNRYYFLDAAIHHFQKNTPRGSIEHALADELESAAYCLLMDAAIVAVDLVPKLQRLLPWQEYSEIYAAMMADDEETPEGATEQESEN